MKTLKQLADMKGRNVIITGGLGYLGKIMAETMAELGASIILIDKKKDNLDEFHSDLIHRGATKIRAIKCDLESEVEIDEVLNIIKNDYKYISCLVNNAAFVGTSELNGWVTKFENQSLETWRRAVEVNLTVPFQISKELTPLLRASVGGNIINITSIYGEVGPDWRLYENTDMGNPAAYAASKGGLSQLTRWLATTLAPDIRVNAIAPGGVFRNQTDEFVKRYSDRTPLRRMAVGEDLKGAFAYLATDLSKYVTGQVLKVDGGWCEW